MCLADSVNAQKAVVMIVATLYEFYRRSSMFGLFGILTDLEELLAISKSEALMKIVGIRNPCSHDMLAGIFNNDIFCQLDISPRSRIARRSL